MKVGIHDRWNVGCGIGGQVGQDRKDAEQVKCRTGGMQDRRDAGQV